MTLLHVISVSLREQTNKQTNTLIAVVHLTRNIYFFIIGNLHGGVILLLRPESYRFSFNILIW